MYDPKKVHVMILAGGRGARFDHETQVLPKPMIEVAGKPMLGHIMDLFEAQGFDKFTVVGGYKWEEIDRYLSDRYECSASARDHIRVYGSKGQRPTTHLFNTGEDATTGDRLMKLACEFWPPVPMLGGEDFFVLTYGDGLSNVRIDDVIGQHLAVRTYQKGPRVTLTAVQPPGRFGVLTLYGNDDKVISFSEKSDEDWINGGFMVVDHGVVLRYVPKGPFHDGPYEPFETGALPRLASDGKLYSWCHHDYWRCMDTRRDLEQIEADVKQEGGLPWMKIVRS